MTHTLNYHVDMWRLLQRIATSTLLANPEPAGRTPTSGLWAAGCALVTLALIACGSMWKSLSQFAAKL